VLYYGLILYTDKTNVYDGLKTVSSTLGNIVAVIVGYYFGQRPVQSAIERVQETRSLFKGDISDVLGKVDDTQRRYRQISSDLVNVKEDLKHIGRSNSAFSGYKYCTYRRG
jgi:hypothetical protein